MTALKVAAVCMALHALLVATSTVLSLGDIGSLTDLVQPAFRIVLFGACAVYVVRNSNEAWWWGVIASAFYGVIGVGSLVLLANAGALDQYSDAYLVYVSGLSLTLIISFVSLIAARLLQQ
jgi:hypothetical protein